MKPNLALSLLQAKYNISGESVLNRGVLDDFVGLFFCYAALK
jgi:hypothetical protein